MTARAALLACLLLLGACSSAPDRAPALATGYIGPAQMQLREALVARAEVVAQLEHGEKIEIIGRRRRFLKVRTASGAEGWMDAQQVLSEREMEALRDLAERAADVPSQGIATVFDTLNVHTAPNRQAPSFFQLTSDSKAAVITHQRVPRIPFTEPAFLEELQRPTPVARKKKKKTTQVPPPPTGPAPALPANWKELSGVVEAPPAPPPPPPAPPALEWWTLVRAENGRTGWVLTSMLYLAIPDEVAQYAERARITSYYPLGQVMSQAGEPKTIWLWTTLATRGVDHHFDNLRVFTYNARRDRYETAYIERNLKGWLPITLQQENGRVTGWEGVFEAKDGRIQRISYRWDGTRARIGERRPGEIPPIWYHVPALGESAPRVSIPESNESSGGRLQQMLKTLRERFR